MSAPKPIVTLFYQPTERRKEFVALSDIEFWIGHWDPSINRTRRCGGSICAMCCHGYTKKLSMVCLARDDAGTEYWIEFRERHRACIDQGTSGKGSFAGSRFVVKREGGAKNSPVAINFLNKELVDVREIKNFVEKLGSDPILVSRPSTSEEKKHA